MKMGAFGWYNKVKKWGKNLWNGVKKAASWVNNKIIKPLKPVAKTVATAVAPAAAPVINKVIDTTSSVLDRFNT